MLLALLSGKHASGWTGCQNAALEFGNVMSGAQIGVQLIYERAGNQCSDCVDVDSKEASMQGAEIEDAGCRQNVHRCTRSLQHDYYMFLTSNGQVTVCMGNYRQCGRFGSCCFKVQ